MSWNIRIMRHKSTIKDVDDWYALHEVIYNEKGQVCLWTEDPINMVGNDPQDLLSYLIMSLRDLWRSRHDILDFDMEPEGVPDWQNEDGSMKTDEEDLIDRGSFKQYIDGDNIDAILDEIGYSDADETEV